MTMRTLSLVEAHRLVVAALQASRTSVKNAESVAAALVAAETVGQSGHGLRRLEAYCAQARAGKVDGYAVASLAQSAPGALIVDAAHGFAFPAIDLVVAELPALARAQGIAMAGVRRSHHCGAMGTTVERLALEGIVGLMVSNTPGAIAPWGGRTPLLGTNPIAFAAPVAGDAPIVADLSLSKVARGRIMAAKQKGEAIPDDWALDRDGNPTTDPAAALDGTMAPIGEAKGVALALMVEILAAGLTGANFSADASSFFDDAGDPPGVGQLLIGFAPRAFGGADRGERFARLAGMIAADGDARLPGRRRQQMRQTARERGIEADAELVARIEAIAAQRS